MIMVRMNQGRLNNRVFDRIREYNSVGGYERIWKTNEKGNRKVKNNRQKLPGKRTIRKKIKRNLGSCGK